MSQQEANLEDMIVEGEQGEEILNIIQSQGEDNADIEEMIDRNVANLVQHYLAREGLARDEVLLVEVSVEMEIDGQARTFPLTQTWSWGPAVYDVSVDALMQQDADARFDVGDVVDQ